MVRLPSEAACSVRKFRRVLAPGSCSNASAPDADATTTTVIAATTSVIAATTTVISATQEGCHAEPKEVGRSV